MTIPGTFYNHGTKDELFTIHRAARLVGLPVHEITTAISNGTLAVHEVSGCKCVKLADLVAYVKGGA
ncbi:hypothetical protein [Marinobacter sp. LQ44]|uniref:hypothetical protein n=1 Tax=Marinobacter sp. LQ44 TaxID=1749259 RepID=UPI00071903AA|nr:hypothetical protein [Marinobacter sp. LQ44]AMQ87357.1 hypothetical protein ASQ50_00895 [Marinobacter sp. LQ44]